MFRIKLVTVENIKADTVEMCQVRNLFLACSVRVYHTEHLCRGFIGDPKGQLKAAAKSHEFDSGPRTLMGPGEWTDDRIFVRASSGLIEPHQI